MAKKTWIKIKRGILEPKHRIQLGSAWFLYFYILDNVGWEDGKIIEWRDKDAADELEIPLSTLREYRRRLEDYQYISSIQKHHRLEITVKNWTNPREYSGEVYNSDGNEDTVPLENDDGLADGYKDGYKDGNENPSPLPIINISHTTDHNDYSAEETAPPELTRVPCDDDGLEIPQKPPKKRRVTSNPQSKTPAIMAFRLLTGKYPKAINYQDIIDAIGDEPDEAKLAACYKEWCGRGYNPASIKWATEWYKTGIPSRNGNGKSEPKGMAAVREELERLEAVENGG